jgi:hypothetical protein
MGAVNCCRVCGCSDDDACVVDGEPCGWVEPDLCSGCIDQADEPGFQRDGKSGLWLPVGMV